MIRARWWRPLAAPVAMLMLWEVASRAAWVDPRFLPPIETLAVRFWTEMQQGLAWDIAASLRREMTGFAIGGTLGVALGLLLGLSRPAERLLGPTFLGFRQVALFAWVPLLAMWLGAGEEGKIAFIALAAIQPSVVNTWRGTRDIPRGHAELAAALTFTHADYVRFIALPGALPAILTGLRTALIYAWLATVGAELFLNIAPGLGGRMNEGREMFQMDLVLVCVVVLGVLAITMGQLAELAETRWLRRRAK